MLKIKNKINIKNQCDTSRLMTRIMNTINLSLYFAAFHVSINHCFMYSTTITPTRPIRQANSVAAHGNKILQTTTPIHTVLK